MTYYELRKKDKLNATVGPDDLTIVRTKSLHKFANTVNSMHCSEYQYEVITVETDAELQEFGTKEEKEITNMLKPKYNLGDKVYLLLTDKLKYVEGTVVGIYCGPELTQNPRYKLYCIGDIYSSDMDDYSSLEEVRDRYGELSYTIVETIEELLFPTEDALKEYILNHMVTKIF